MTTRHEPDSVLAGGGEMGALMRATDWSQTAVGPVESWPQSLRTALSILLETGFPMYIAWGAQYTQFYNDGYRPILGSTKHPAAMGRSTRETFAEIWDIIGPMFQGVMQGTATTLVDFLLPLDRHGFAEECYFIFSYSPIREEGGRVGGILVTVTETTSRIVGERRLKSSQALAAETRNARTVEEACQLAGGVLAENPDDLPFVLIYRLESDQRQVRLMSSASIEAGGRFSPLVVDLADEDGPYPFAAVVRSGQPMLFERLHLPSASPATPAATRAVVLPITEQGAERPVGILVAAISPRLILDDAYRDFLALIASQIGTAIAGAKTLEEAKARAEALAELDRAKTTFFNNVSHEFRTPLTLMLGPTEEALASADRALSGENLETVHRNELRLLKLVNTLLDFSRIEAGRVTASFEPTDLAAMTADLASAFRSAMDRAGLQLNVQCPPLPAPVYVDRDMWEKIVLNLLSNALKFTFSGSIMVELACEDAHVELRVRDTGIGIAPADLEHVFDRFHRIEHARARTQEGSGIGLALVRELVTMHGGTITASSEVGAGTTFSVRLPTGSAHLPANRIGLAAAGSPTRAGAAPYVEEALRWLPAANAAPAPPARRRPSAGLVLVADDNADMREYIARLLSPGWDVETVGDGLAALDAVRRRRPDVIVSDVMMPGLDGFGLLDALRSDEATRMIPVILLSARAGEEARIDGLHAGADEYLAKPFSARELIACVEAQLVRAKVRSELTRATRHAESASRAKDEFLAMLGHELRNPLAPILTALQLMRLRGITGAERERTIIERQVKHMVALVDDLLDVSRITRGKIQLKTEPTELADVVAKAIEMTSPAFEERRHVLNVEVPRGLVVEGDPARLAQVVANLLTNAAKYTDAGGQIDVTGLADGSAAVLRVADNGTGIAPETLATVFDLFAQERQDIDRSQGGLGLGLAIVRNLVQAHGGTVVADSDGKGRGSTFTVRLPAAARRRAVAQATEAAPIRALAADGFRILIVDDNVDAAELLGDSLAALGHLTRVAFDGPSALDAATAFVPDVVLLDLGLPVMDGFEVAEHLKADPRLKDVLLVAVTGYGQVLDRQRTHSVGFDSHIVKPVDLDHLNGWLRSKRRAG